jgi:hypothetical protein
MPKDAHIAVWREIASRQADGRSTKHDLSQIDMAAWPAHRLSDSCSGRTHKKRYLLPQKIQTPKKAAVGSAKLTFSLGNLHCKRLQGRSQTRLPNHGARLPSTMEMGAAIAELRVLNGKQ